MKFRFHYALLAIAILVAVYWIASIYGLFKEGATIEASYFGQGWQKTSFPHVHLYPGAPHIPIPSSWTSLLNRPFPKTLVGKKQ